MGRSAACRKSWTLAVQCTDPLPPGSREAEETEREGERDALKTSGPQPCRKKERERLPPFAQKKSVFRPLENSSLAGCVARHMKPCNACFALRHQRKGDLTPLHIAAICSHAEVPATPVCQAVMYNNSLLPGIGDVLIG